MYKKFFEGKKGILFDLDGTIINSTPYWNQAYKNILATITNIPINVQIIPGRTLAENWDHILTTYSITSKITIKDLVEHTRTEFLKLFIMADETFIEGFGTALNIFKLDKHYKVGLVTNSSRTITSQLLGYLQASNSFDIILCEEDVRKPKPDPEIYNTAAKKLQLKPKEILVFEDSPTGAEASVRAHMDTIIIWTNLLDKRRYPQEVLEFFPDFIQIYQNMDKTFKELFEAARKQYLEEEKAKVTDAQSTSTTPLSKQ